MPVLVPVMLVGAVLLLLAGSSIWAAHAADVEQPAYTLLAQEGAFELRDYAPGIEARTTVGSPERADMSSGFRRLAGYIFGKNQGSQSIAMTAPVGRFRTPSGWQMTFAMPSAYTLDDLPVPMDQDVEIVPVEARVVAALRFSGRATSAVASEREGQLRTMLTARGLVVTGPARLAQYDPPSQLPPFRRNEILIPVQRQP